MRMRKKKHAKVRMDACRELLIPLCKHELDYRQAEFNPSYLNFAEIFGNQNSVQLEVGCGKGGFITELAKRTPDINYIAIEVCDDVAVMAAEAVTAAGLKNVRFMVMPAEYLLKYFPDNSLDRIYLNFSCPFPKNKYAKHRLAAPKFMYMYRKILKNGAEIHQKTDNMHFFEFSIENLSEYGFKLKNLSLDLHKSDFEGNIVTEYEKRFTELGQPIYRLEAVNSKE